uniref:sigma factor-like helix-turn-helix DNA-binding protein n=1 Tax=Gemmiger sp. TaxID=2049027 RepID=UPI003FF14030
MALPPPDGELFLRRYLYGETAAQLGVHFNMPAATVRTRLHRARLAGDGRSSSAVFGGRRSRSAGAFPPHERRQRDERTGAEVRRGAGRTADRRDQRPHGQCKGAAARRKHAASAVRCGQRPRDGAKRFGVGHRRVLPACSGQQRRQAALYCKQRTGRAMLWVRHWFVGNAQRGQRRRRSLLLCGYSVDPDGHRHANAVYLRFNKSQGLCIC